MTVPTRTSTGEASFGRDVLKAADYYLNNRWAVLTLVSLVVIPAIFFNGWEWLVAAGVAPVILSTLPCLVMCGFGVCAMCRSKNAKH